MLNLKIIIIARLKRRIYDGADPAIDIYYGGLNSSGLYIWHIICYKSLC